MRTRRPRTMIRSKTRKKKWPRHRMAKSHQTSCERRKARLTLEAEPFTSASFVKKIAPGQYAWNEARIRDFCGRHVPPAWINGNWSAAQLCIWMHAAERLARENFQRSNNLGEHPGKQDEKFWIDSPELSCTSLAYGKKEALRSRDSCRAAVMQILYALCHPRWPLRYRWPRHQSETLNTGQCSGGKYIIPVNTG